MGLDSIDREEFDRRLQQSTAQMRRERLTMESQAAELEDLIGRYSAMLERAEAEAEAEADAIHRRREDLRSVLTELPVLNAKLLC